MLWKLIIFSILMAVVPIGTYFTSLKYLFNGERSIPMHLLYARPIAETV